MLTRYSTGLAVAFAAIISLCAAQDTSFSGGGGVEKSVIYELDGQVVEIHVPAQFVSRLDELETRRRVLHAQGRAAEAERVYEYNMGSHNAARTQIVAFRTNSKGLPEFNFHATPSDANKMSRMISTNNSVGGLKRTLYPSPPGLQLALQNAAASAQTTRLISTQNPRPDSVHVITLGGQSDFPHSTDYSPMSEKMLIFEGAGQTVAFEIPELLFPILYTCVREGISQKKGESENTKPALDFHIIEDSVNRVTRFALADEGIPHFLVVATETNLDAIKQMMAAPDPYTYRISSPIPAVPAQAVSPVPAPAQTYIHRDMYGRDIRQKGRLNSHGWTMDTDVPIELINQLTPEEYEAIINGN